MTLDDNYLSVSSIKSDYVLTTHISVSSTTSHNVHIPSDGTISFGSYTFSAQELGTLLHYLQQLHPESQI